MKQLLFFVFVIFVCSCTSTESVDEEPITLPENSFFAQPFYYPVEELAAGKVYEYVNINEGEEYLSHYWLLKSEKEANGNHYLIWEGYNPYFQKNQYIKELVFKEGVITNEYKLYILDSASQKVIEYPNNISQNVVFPFYASMDSIMAYRFECEMKLPPDFLTSKLIRDRKFKQEVKYNYQGKELDAIAFTLTDLYDLENKEGGGFWQLKKGSVEVYAKGIGLVFQEEKTAGVEGSEITRLKNIYTLEEFEKMKQQ